jgi:hypothetical protein
VTQTQRFLDQEVGEVVRDREHVGDALEAIADTVIPDDDGFISSLFAPRDGQLHGAALSIRRARHKAESCGHCTRDGLSSRSFGLKPVEGAQSMESYLAVRY